MFTGAWEHVVFTEVIVVMVDQMVDQMVDPASTFSRIMYQFLPLLKRTIMHGISSG